jgi:hypothetical protein
MSLCKVGFVIGQYGYKSKWSANVIYTFLVTELRQNSINGLGHS